MEGKMTYLCAENKTRKEMTLDEAFEKLISTRNWGKLVEKTPNEACIYKTRFRKNKLRNDIKRDLLIKSGLFLAIEEWFEKPTK